MVSREIFNIILSLAVGVIRRLAKNLYSVAASPLTVSIDILDADHDRRFQGDVACGLNQDHRAISNVQLSSMISHADAQGEPECFAQETNRFANVGISEFWKHSASRHGAIR